MDSMPLQMHPSNSSASSAVFEELVKSFISGPRRTPGGRGLIISTIQSLGLSGDQPHPEGLGVPL